MNARRRKIRNILFILTGVILVGGIAFMAFIAFVLTPAIAGIGESLNNTMCDPSNPSGFETVAQIKFPPSAKNLQSVCGGWQGWLVEARFEMDPSDLETFVATTRIKFPLSTSGEPGQLLFRDKTIKPSSYLYGKYEVSDWHEEIFIDTSNASRYIVHFLILGG